VGDTFNPVNPDTLGARFERAGFVTTRIERDDYQVRFAASK
jgi:hypothetical protein